MGILQTIKEMKEKLRKEIGDVVDTIDDKVIKEYYMG